MAVGCGESPVSPFYRTRATSVVVALRDPRREDEELAHPARVDEAPVPASA